VRKPGSEKATERTQIRGGTEDMVIRKNGSGKIVGAICVTILLGIAAALCPQAAFADPKPAPDIKLKGLDGQKYALSDYQGKIVIVNFWAVWCPPCKVEIPELIELYNTYKDQGLMVFGIAIDSGKDEKIQEKAVELKINYPVINGDEYYIRKAFGGIRAVPTTFMINREGKFHKEAFVGYQKKEVLEEEIKSLLEP
jgi:peroxiredoxin